MVGPIPVPSATAPDAHLSPDIDAWMARAMARDPAARFASAKELSESFMIATGTTDSFKRTDPPERESPLPPNRPTNAPDALGETVAAPEMPPKSPVVPSSLRPAPSRLPWIVAVVVLSAMVATLGALLALRP